GRLAFISSISSIFFISFHIPLFEEMLFITKPVQLNLIVLAGIKGGWADHIQAVLFLYYLSSLPHSSHALIPP
ncbi:hypothetical protein, partial [Methanothrix sp.]|uniref:hypothetical protein n=1 Tax=Methanothrix sp. TaxID=90426 RepID=UPI003BB767D4